MTIYATQIEGGTLEGSLNNANIIWAKVASGTTVKAGMTMCWTTTNHTVEAVDSSDAVTALRPFAGVAAADYPSVKLDQFYDDGQQRGYIIIDTDSENYTTPTSYNWADIDQVVGLITKGRVEVWMASGTSGTAAVGAQVVPAHGLVGTKFDGMMMVFNDVALTTSGAFRPVGVIVSGTTSDIEGSTYGTTTAKLIAKVVIDLY